MSIILFPQYVVSVCDGWGQYYCKRGPGAIDCRIRHRYLWFAGTQKAYLSLFRTNPSHTPVVYDSLCLDVSISEIYRVSIEVMVIHFGSKGWMPTKTPNAALQGSSPHPQSPEKPSPKNCTFQTIIVKNPEKVHRYFCKRFTNQTTLLKKERAFFSWTGSIYSLF